MKLDLESAVLAGVAGTVARVLAARFTDEAHAPASIGAIAEPAGQA